ncbi:type I polyketide synthase [Nocardia brevicatena]|uniref:type I polyketide synthase n=1 Tax=Nocardia brevicatena TaxID=37327 RepID=UPI0002FA2FE5|nr:type I polyketide synthase [Nocardia brevicatena]
MICNDYPIAIVGIGLRFPGGNNSPAEFAQFLKDGRSGITKIPPGRLPSVPPDVCTDGGYLDDIQGFDANFFNISPREAAFVDPQHRLTLETSWEALENAGIDPRTLRHGDTGVYVAVAGMDYAMEIARLPVEQVELYAGTGMLHCGASGRVSYFLGLRGPSMSVDTACSSSLVAVHLAVQGLRMGECSLALCGAANTISDPTYPVMAGRAGVLAEDARCKTFDDAADGYVRGEGVAMIVLKRLDDARRDGDRVLAIIRGSAVRQDGESAALMAPNGQAQASLMRAALENAGLTADDIQYVEAHGTGTALGDPIEISGLTEVFSRTRSVDNSVFVGSVKTNIGHLESAAGMAGLIKTVLQFQDETIYPHLNCSTMSRRIPWEKIPIRIPLEAIPWEAATRRAIVNSYGATGTIASLVLEEAYSRAHLPQQPERNDKIPAIFTLSAKDPTSLRSTLDSYAEFLKGATDQDLVDICYTSNVGRAHHTWRISSPIGTTAELTQFIEHQRERLHRLRANGGSPNVAAMFPGGGSQYRGMGRGFYRRFPVFRHHVDQCSELFSGHIDYSIKDAIIGNGEQDLPSGAGILSASIFTLEYALARLWLSLGVRPGVLVGHSLGEIAAATVAGIFDVEDAARLISFRGALLDKTSPGSMAAVEAAPRQVQRILEDFPDVSLGAVNGHTQCVISGESGSVKKIGSILEGKGFKVTHLHVPVASHSPLMDEIAADYRAFLATIEFGDPEYPIASTVTGAIAKPGEMTTVEYWMRHLRNPVNFAEAVRSIENRGSQVFLEIGPGAEMIGMGRQCTTRDDHIWLGSMHRADLGGKTILHSVSRLYNAGLPISWTAWHDGVRGNRAALPTYSFHRKPYWIPASHEHTDVDDLMSSHPLLGAEISTESERTKGVRTFRTQVGSSRPAYLAGHTLGGTPVFPGTGFVEMLLAVQDILFGEATRPIGNLGFHEPLFLSQETTSLRISVQQCLGGPLKVKILSGDGESGGAADRLHVSAQIGGSADTDLLDFNKAIDEMRSISAADAATELVMNSADVTEYYRRRGVDHGSMLRTLRRATRYAGATVIGELEVPAATLVDFLHPALLAGAFQSIACLLGDKLADNVTFVSVGAERVRLFRKPRGSVLRSVLHVLHADEEKITADLALLDENGDPVFGMNKLVLQRISATNSAVVEVNTSRSPIVSEFEANKAIRGEAATFDLGSWKCLPVEQRRRSVCAFLASCIAELLHFQHPDELPAGATFFEIGMDSIIAIKLKNAVEDAFRIRLEARAIFENPSIDDLAEVLLAKATIGTLCDSDPR